MSLIRTYTPARLTEVTRGRNPSRRRGRAANTSDPGLEEPTRWFENEEVKHGRFFFIATNEYLALFGITGKKRFRLYLSCFVVDLPRDSDLTIALQLSTRRTDVVLMPLVHFYKERKPFRKWREAPAAIVGWHLLIFGLFV